MSENKQPEYDEYGALRLSSLANLSYGELKSWLYGKLTGYEPARAGVEEEPHYQLVEVYPRLSPEGRLIREDIQDILIGFIEDFTRAPHSIWRSDSGRFLFLLFDPILLNSARKEYVIEQLTNLLEDTVLVAEITGTANHRRVLQGLVTLRFRGNVDFWRWQASIGSQDVFPAIFEGLCNLDLAAGFDWLSGNMNPDAAGRIVLDYLPYLINSFGFSALRHLILSLLPKLPDPYQLLIVDYCRHDGLELDFTPTPHPMIVPRRPLSSQTEILDPPELVVGAGVSGPMPRLEALYRQYYLGGEWKWVIRQLAQVLPRMIEEEAQNTERTVPDIVHDVFRNIRSALQVDYRGPAQIRVEQATCAVVWVAAQPFLDLVEEEYGGFYNSSLHRLNQDGRLVFFQFDRSYFDAFLEKLRNDTHLASSVVIDEDDPRCQVLYVPIEKTFTAVSNFAIWDPGEESMKVLINADDPIELRKENGQWRLVRPVTMKPIRDPARSNLLYRDLKKAYEKYKRHMPHVKEVVIRR